MSEVNIKGLKDFELIQNKSISEKAELFYEYYLHNVEKQYTNYRIVSKNGNDAVMKLINPYTNEENDYISFVSNDYLGFTKHPKIAEATIKAIQTYGSGAGSSPLIGGQSLIHEELEQKVAKFFNKEAALTFSSGYMANSGTFMTLLQKEDLAILDMGVHASIQEGCCLTNKKFFLHNDLESLERVLQQTKDMYRNRMIIIDGVYSQDGDMAILDKIQQLAQQYGVYLAMDDAHGIGVIGEKGKGIIEKYNLYDKVDIITGTFSKSLASVGGFVVANKKIITFLKFFSDSNIFSTGATPQSAAAAIKAMELLEEEPKWKIKLWENINYFKENLNTLGFDYGKTESAIFPIMVRDEEKTKEIGKMFFKLGIYANPILYPAVSRKQTRIRMSIIATHTKEQIDKTLNILEDIDKIYKIKKAV